MVRNGGAPRKTGIVGVSGVWALVIVGLLVATPAMSLVDAPAKAPEESALPFEATGAGETGPVLRLDGSLAREVDAGPDDAVIAASTDPWSAMLDAQADWLQGLGSFSQDDLLFMESEERSVSTWPDCPDSIPGCPWTDGGQWLVWASEVELDRLVETSHAVLDAHAGPALRAPDAHPGYAGAEAAAQRDAWIDWWLLVAQDPAGSMTPFSALGSGASQEEAEQQGGVGGEANEGGEGEEEEAPKVGKPRNLMSLWRLQAHGEPLAVHPWGESGHLVMTEYGAFHFSSWEESADWMVQFNRPLGGWAPVGKTEVIAGASEDEGLLVIEYPDLWGWGEWDTIQAIDLSDGTVVYSGFAGERAAREWSLAGGDQAAIHVVDHQGSFIRVELPEGKEVPLTNVVQSPGPVSMAFGFFSRANLHSLALGDATGDGVQDLFVVREMSNSGIVIGGQTVPDPRLVTLYDGTNGDVVWDTVAEWQADNYLIWPGDPVVGDLTGDGQADLVFNELRLGFFGSSMGRVVTGVSGDDGSVLFHDKGTMTCPVEAQPLSPLCIETGYQPVAVLGGDAQPGRIVGLVGDVLEAPTSLVVRSLPEVPGLASQLDEAAAVQMPIPFWHNHPGRVVDWVGPGGDAQVLVTPFSEPGLGGRMHLMQGTPKMAYHVARGSVTQNALGSELTNLFLDPATGGFSGWFRGPDHLAPLDEEYTRAAKGQRMILDVSPVLWHDADDDGVPDMLLRKTTGYVWLSGVDASAIREVDLAPDANFRSVGYDGDRPVLLERRNGTYSYGGLEADDPDWSFPEEVLEEGYIWNFRDFTGDGKMELMIRNYPVFQMIEREAEPGSSSPTPQEPEEPEKWRVFSPSDQKWLWEIQDEDLDQIRVVDLLKDHEGSQILLTYADDDGEDQEIHLHVVGEKSPRWKWDIGERLVAEMVDGYIVLVEFEEDEEDDEGQEEIVVDIHRASDRERVNRLVFDEDRPVVGFHMMELQEDQMHIIYSYGTKIDGAKEGEPQAQQRLRVTRAEGGAASVDFATSDEGFDVREDSDGEERLVMSGRLTYFMGSFGDWSGSGLDDLVLSEDEHVVVRSSTTSTILAVVPNYGYLRTLVDLNGDGRDEFGLYDYEKRQLRMYAYDGKAGELPDEDAGSGRIALTGDANRTKDMDKFFDQKESPGPAAFVLVAVLAGLLAVRRLGARRK